MSLEVERVLITIVIIMLGVGGGGAGCSYFGREERIFLGSFCGGGGRVAGVVLVVSNLWEEEGWLHVMSSITMCFWGYDGCDEEIKSNWIIYIYM